MNSAGRDLVIGVGEAGGANSPIRIALYLLPGPTRSKDRLVPVGEVKLGDYVRGRTDEAGATLWDASSIGVSQGILCEWMDGRREIFPFVIPCYFCEQWVSLEAAAESLACQLVKAEPVGEDEPIGRSVLTTLMCLVDGTVHECKRFGGQLMLQCRQWPVQYDVRCVGAE